MAKLKVFLSYRRDDLHGLAQGIVGRIYDRLEDHYGDGNVFMDIDNIPPGVNFVEYLDSWVGRAEVVLAVIGPQWAELLESRGLIGRERGSLRAWERSRGAMEVWTAETRLSLPGRSLLRSAVVVPAGPKMEAGGAAACGATTGPADPIRHPALRRFSRPARAPDFG